MTNQDIYIASDTYHTMLDKLEHIARTFDPAAPDDLRTQLVQAVGEDGGIWPEDCLNEGKDMTARLVA
ncbi:hypothetical protein GCM10011491_01390 [Brucella endophytica]|uniref:Uncharacterized protein n=1 Tax=Brucella endophytica TaxID=1963359 RepID=A0A916RZE9_9HYPH|nr:hypothetical protein [Brucella endophytica]GGA77935.1 hypothetical protein GCM10011491_01390 [Brucella endophytica]